MHGGRNKSTPVAPVEPGEIVSCRFYEDEGAFEFQILPAPTAILVQRRSNSARKRCLRSHEYSNNMDKTILLRSQGQSACLSCSTQCNTENNYDYLQLRKFGSVRVLG